MRRRSSSNNQQNKFLKLVTLPFRALGKARDVYVRSLTSCAGRVNYGAASGGPVYACGLPRSFSTASSRSGDGGGEDFRELLRVASAKEARRAAAAGGPRGLPKSCSVGMRRIDEDEACEFGDDEVVGVVRGDDVWRRRSTGVIYRRSRSHDGLGNVGGGFLR